MFSDQTLRYLESRDIASADILPTGKENIVKIRDAVKFATQESQMPKRGFFDMNHWFNGGALTKGQPIKCGTTFCLAGWSAYDNLEDGEVMGPMGHIYESADHDEPIDHAGSRGQKIMGLSYAQSDALFHCPNNIEVIREIAEFIAGEAL